jgi:integrase
MKWVPGRGCSGTPDYHFVASAAPPIVALSACRPPYASPCRRAGLEAAEFSGHSLRSGYVTSCVEANAPVMKIAEQTRHKSLDMLRVYSRRVDLFREHSGAAFL